MTKQKPIVRVLSFLARAGVSAAFIAAGVGIYAWLYETRAQPPASDPSATGRLRLLVTEPIEQPVGRRFRAFGQARAVNVADVPARVSATVAKIHPNYREGATVAAGEPLVSLDDSDFKRQLTMSDEALRAIDAQLSMLTLDEASLKRALELAKDGVIVDWQRTRELFGERLEVGDVATQLWFAVGPLDLDSHLATVAQRRRVHLRN